MRRVTTTRDILAYINECCGQEAPGRTDEEICDYINNHKIKWHYQEDLETGYPYNDEPRSNIGRIVDEMFETNWIWG